MQIKMKGMTEQEVLKSREEFGSNEIIQKERNTFWGKVLDTIKSDPIIQILFAALVVQLVFYYFDFVHWYEPFGIFIAVTLATLVGTWSEFSSENQFQDLQEEASRIHCKVFRDGLLKEILINEIVVGDLVVLQTGDKIPADGILVAGELKSNQVSLNGENESTRKLPAPQNFVFDSNEHDAEGSPLMNPYKLYRESVVEDGEAVMQTMKVGKKTLSGSLSMGENVEIDSPLKAKLSELAKGISMFGYIGGSAIAIAFVLVKAFLHPTLAAGATTYFSMANLSNIGPDIVHAIILAILIIVMAVPEGLPMMIAIVLSLNMKKLLKDNILVRKMVGIETAGSLNILFSDKTGTITEGKLSVVHFYSGDEVEYNGYDILPTLLKEWVDISLSVNTNASYNKRDDGTIQVIGGNVTEKALLHFVHDEIRSHDVEVVSRLNFNSTDKFMASQVKGSHNCTLVKGAPDVLLDRCTSYYTKDGLEAPLNAVDHKKLNEKIDFYASKAMRVVAITTSQKEIIIADSISGEPDRQILSLDDMTFVGLVAIRDDIKPSSKEAFRLMTEAGVQVVMITGDRKETAYAIAQDMGMLSPDSLILTSQELQAMSDVEVKKAIPHLRVVSRALPHDKLRLVKLSQELGLVSGMTGDGANDKPALEKADVGFSMGSGTEVAKEASDIVILDDSLDAISKTTLYGRTIYKSIQKFIKFQVTVSFGAILIAFVGPFIGVDLPLSMTQILWVNLIMDTLAALALGGEPSLTRYMAEKPKKRTEAIISVEMWSAIVTTGLFIVVSALIYLKATAVFVFFCSDTKTFQTGFFLFFVLANVLNLINVRNQKLNIFEHITENQYFLPVFSLIVALQLLMTYFGGDIMRGYGLSLAQFCLIVGWTMLIFAVDAVRKIIFDAVVKAIGKRGMSPSAFITFSLKQMLLALLLLLTIPLSVLAAGDLDELLPPNYCGNGWKIDGKPLLYNQDTLSDRIDGEAELYFPYGFARLAAARYASEKKTGAGIDVEVYQMGSLLDAYGMFANYRQKDGRAIGVGADSNLSASQLFLYQGRYFVHIQVTGAEDNNLDVMSECGRTVVSRLPGTRNRPNEISFFDRPEVIKGTERYLPQSLLGYDFLNRGIIADAVMDGANLQIFLILGTTSESASTAFNGYRSQLSQVKIEPANKTATYLEGVDPLYGPVVILRKADCLAGALRFSTKKGIRSLLDSFCK